MSYENRMKIQYGMSLVYPISTIGAHVAAVPNHVTGATTRSHIRGLVAMSGTYGFELVGVLTIEMGIIFK